MASVRQAPTPAALFPLTFITEGRMRTLPTGIYALLSSEFYGN